MNYRPSWVFSLRARTIGAILTRGILLMGLWLATTAGVQAVTCVIIVNGKNCYCWEYCGPTESATKGVQSINWDPPPPRHPHLSSPALHQNTEIGVASACPENNYCGTLPGDFDWVYGEVGIYYFAKNINQNIFVPLYVREAALSGAGAYLIPYRIPKWDGKVFWMTINQKSPPIALQPFYLDRLPGCTGCMQFISHAMLYQKKGQDYSAYPYGAALMYMYIEVDAQFRVRKYTIDVYDQDDNLVQTGVTLNLGDKVLTLYAKEDDKQYSGDWVAVKVADPVVVTQKPAFTYFGFIPGRDFGCAYCTGNIDLSKANVYFRLAGYVHDQATDTDHVTYSARTLLGKLPNLAAKSIVTTGAATNIAARSARLTGKLNPNGFATTYYFEYGATTAYGRRTAGLTAPPTATQVAAAANLGQLVAATRYHFRLVASNSAGTITGGDRTFVTLRVTAMGVGSDCGSDCTDTDRAGMPTPP